MTVEDHSKGDQQGAPNRPSTGPRSASEPATLPGPVRPYAPVTFLPERYFDLGPIARGGWGEVRRVRDRRVERVVAMKILAMEHLETARLRARFLNEAMVTASLEHPGIVAVHDRGVLSDGRPWFTMKEVRGRTLADLLREPAARDDEGGRLRFRRLVEIFLRIAETVGFAHGRGVVHRDIKPGNVMVGEFGETLVLDWGVARSADEQTHAVQQVLDGDADITYPGEILGTASYMSPEQARGGGPEVGPPSDVYSLGLVLYEILTGVRARPVDRVRAWAEASIGTVPPVGPSPLRPEELCELTARALSVDPAMRPRHAMALAEEVRRWLDGSARRERANFAVEAAAALVPELGRLRRERDQLRTEARSLLANVRDFDPVELKVAAWEREDHAVALEHRIAALAEERIATLRGALQHAPDHRAAHAALAATHRAQMIEAEANGALADAARFELLVRRHDRGEHQRFLEGRGRLSLSSRPNGARARAYRFERRGRRLVLGEPIELGTTPLAVDIEAGSYLVELEAEGHAKARVPALVPRDAEWSAIRPSGREQTPIPLLASLADDEVYVAAGWSMVGGDQHAAEPVPSRNVWIDGFVAQRTSVTVGQYLAFLDALDVAAAVPLVPRGAFGGLGSGDRPLATRIDGRWVAAEGAASLDWPVASIDWYAACAYARWLAETTRLPWRLPDELEWEKTARGVDGRSYPWGEQPEPTWARMLGSTEDTPSRVKVGSHPIDESPYGARDMAGNVRVWCAGTWTPEGPSVVDGILRRAEPAPDDLTVRVIRGGAWSTVPMLARCAGRFAARPHERFAWVGVRLVRSIEAPSQGL